MAGAPLTDPRVRPDVAAIQRALASGAAATESVTLGHDGDPTPCALWSLRDLVRHLEIIAGAYVLWVGAAIGGRVGTLRMGGAQDAWNAELLARLPARDTAAHRARFAALAGDHRRLVAAAADLPMFELAGGARWTVGDHAGVVALEWHVHAWDLAAAAGQIHRPAPDDVATLAGVWEHLQGPAVGVPLPVLDDAWAAILTAAGRRP
jgi:hypothetical protein